MKMLLGRKLGMTRIFDKNGLAIPVTLAEAGPCIVTQVKSEEKEDYSAVQIGFGETKHINKPRSGHLKKSGAKAKWLKEFRVTRLPARFDARRARQGDSSKSEEGSASISDKDQDQRQSAIPKVGDKITVEVFKPGDIVTVSGISKGKGFAGVVKRHHFAGGPGSHGSDQHRAPGSIGAQQPQRVWKGTRMAGHMGQEKKTIKSAEIVEINAEKNILFIKGPVPGAKNSLLEIKSTDRGQQTTAKE